MQGQPQGAKGSAAQQAKMHNHLSNRKMKNTFNMEESLFPSPMSGPHYTDGSVWKTGSVSHGLSKRFTNNNNTQKKMDLSGDLLAESRMGKSKLVSLR